ncbi:hypothetical protein CO151_10325 [bacterium CG_4_9_14_3_um_filter_65_15]|nr:MAG: hypothetical protein CO151_10325 [bacterium CG_4_9_14_3_um_filter_65_15]
MSPKVIIMAKENSSRPGVLFWVISIALLLWGLGGISIYLAYFVESPGEFAESAEAEVNREAYAEYVANIPPWAVVVGVGAAVTRLLGALFLLLRRALARPLFIMSTALFLVAMYRAFVLAHVADVMSSAHIFVEVGFVALSFFAVWFSHQNKSKGILK